MPGKIIKIGNFIPQKISGKTYNIGGDAARHLDEANLGWLRPLNLRLVRVEEIPVITEIRNLQGAGNGIIQELLREHLELAAAVSALGPCFYGKKGAGLDKNLAWDKAKIKQLIDRSASAVQGWAFTEIMNSSLALNYFAEVAASEGGRTKPGREDEAGGNPATPLGQKFSSGQKRLSITIDNVDKTGGTVDGKPGAITSFLFTQSPAKEIPDVRFVKLVSAYPFNGKINSVETPPDKIAAALAQAAGVKIECLNAFQLYRRERLDEPMEEFRKMGINFYQDDDGDLFPTFGAGAKIFKLENGYPLHAMLADGGGAAEGGLLLPLIWMGGEVFLRFASASQWKTWTSRYNLTPIEEADIQAAGFLNPYADITLKDVYKNPYADGGAFFGAISDNHHIPNLTAPELGPNMARACAISVVPPGFMRLRIFYFDYEEPRSSVTEAGFMPLIYILRKSNDAGSIKDQVAEWFKNPHTSDRLKREFYQDYYPLLEPYIEGGQAKGYSLNLEVLNQQLGKRYDERDKAILTAVQENTDWIKGKKLTMSRYIEFSSRQADNTEVDEDLERYYEEEYGMA